MSAGITVTSLHDTGDNAYLWSRVVPLLAQSGYRLLVPDLVGYGASEAAGASSIDMASQARWMLEMIDALNIPQVAVVAHDVGSAAAQIMVASAPRRILTRSYEADVHGMNGPWRPYGIRQDQKESTASALSVRSTSPPSGRIASTAA